MKKVSLLDFSDQASGEPQEVHLETEDATVKVTGNLADVYAAALHKVYCKDPDAVSTEDSNTSGSYANSVASQFANAAKNFMDESTEPVSDVVIVGGDIDHLEDAINVAANATQNAPETTVYFVNEDGFKEEKTSLESLEAVLNHIGFRVVRF